MNKKHPIKRKNYTRLEAIKYIWKNSVYGNEWQGAGMWEAVEKILQSISAYFDEEYLNDLLREAEKR